MVLDKARGKINPILDGIAVHIKFSPSVISTIAFLFSIVSLVLYAEKMLIPAAIAVILNGVFDGLDGSVARAQGKASRKGDMLDHVLDRYADAFMLLGVAFNCNVYLSLGALATVLIVSYMGVEAQALSNGRDYGGLLGRADRIVLLFVASIVQPFFVFYSLTPLDVLMLYFIVAGNITVVQRAYRLWKDLG
jgi:archaetidylinositol phosphate synthase